jgi:hypothetical protein
MLSINKFPLILVVLAEIATQISQFILAFFQIVNDSLSTDAIVDGTHEEEMSTSYFVFETASCYNFHFDWLGDV